MNENIKKYIQKNILRIFLVVVFLLFGLYLLSGTFRFYLLNKNIDPNFIIGFLTTTALLLSLIQSLYDKRFNYNIRLVESIESKGLSIIGKLLTIKQKSEILLSTLRQYKKVIESKQIYKDLNNTLSKNDIDDGMELIVAYIQTHFQEVSSEWNDILKKLGIIGNYNSSIVLNYNENINLIIKGVLFKNESLDNIDDYIIKAENINKEIDELAFNMTEKIVSKINESKGKLKNSFDFKI